MIIFLAPAKPENILSFESCHPSSEQMFVCNINITWSKPHLMPENYSIFLINYMNPYETNDTTDHVVPGVRLT